MSDTLALFDDARPLQPIPMPDADVKFMHGFYRPPLTAHYLHTLLDEIAWQQETITLWGKQYLQPRLSAWYGDEQSRYVYSGTLFVPRPWTPTLLKIKEDIEQSSGQRFNSVLLNLYRDEHDSVGWHSDSESELGPAPLIASLSLGETRTFRFRHKQRKELKPVSIELTDGSLLLMGGATQRYWQHTVGKERSVRGKRINLTFRTILQRK